MADVRSVHRILTILTRCELARNGGANDLSLQRCSLSSRASRRGARCQPHHQLEWARAEYADVRLHRRRGVASTEFKIVGVVRTEARERGVLESMMHVHTYSRTHTMFRGIVPTHHDYSFTVSFNFPRESHTLEMNSQSSSAQIFEKIRSCFASLSRPLSSEKYGMNSV